MWCVMRWSDTSQLSTGVAIISEAPSRTRLYSQRPFVCWVKASKAALRQSTIVSGQGPGTTQREAATEGGLKPAGTPDGSRRFHARDAHLFRRACGLKAAAPINPRQPGQDGTIRRWCYLVLFALFVSFGVSKGRPQCLRRFNVLTHRSSIHHEAHEEHEAKSTSEQASRN